jgi:hypothetical protein
MAKPEKDQILIRTEPLDLDFVEYLVFLFPCTLNISCTPGVTCPKRSNRRTCSRQPRSQVTGRGSAQSRQRGTSPSMLASNFLGFIPGVGGAAVAAFSGYAVALIDSKTAEGVTAASVGTNALGTGLSDTTTKIFFGWTRKVRGDSCVGATHPFDLPASQFRLIHFRSVSISTRPVHIAMRKVFSSWHGSMKYAIQTPAC